LAGGGAGREETGQPLGAFRQNWIGVPGRAVGHREHPLDEGVGHMVMEQVRHRTGEVDRGLPAPERLVEAVRVQG
jgi:hypothetical protein